MPTGDAAADSVSFEPAGGDGTLGVGVSAVADEGAGATSAGPRAESPGLGLDASEPTTMPPSAKKAVAMAMASHRSIDAARGCDRDRLVMTVVPVLTRSVGA